MAFNNEQDDFKDYQHLAGGVVGRTMETLNACGYYDAIESSLKKDLWRILDESFKDKDDYMVEHEAQIIIDKFKDELSLFIDDERKVKKILSRLKESVFYRFGGGLEWSL